MFSQACIIPSVHRGVCMAGVCVWQGACMVGGMCGRKTCMAGGHAWRGVGVGACVFRETATAADCTHTTGTHSCIN